MVYDIVIIGGGASGLISAIKAAETNGNLNIAIAEKNQRVGKKILSTGNGRCNLSNADVSLEHFHGEHIDVVDKVFSKFSLNDTLEFFTSIGVLPYKNEEGKYYPNSLQASSVLDMLRLKVDELGVDVLTEYSVIKIKYKGNFYLTFSNGKSIVAKKIIIATGGKAAPNMGCEGDGYNLLSQFGHSVTKLYPSLVQIKCPSKSVVPMKGVKVNANVKMLVEDSNIREEYGEVLFTDYGLSGPPIFQLSRIAAKSVDESKKTVCELDIIPYMSLESLTDHILNRNKNIVVDEFLTGLFNKQISKMLLKEVGLEKFGVLSNVLSVDQLKKIAYLCKHWKFDVVGTNSWMQAQVTAGGVRTNEFDYATLESKKQSGIYACGEVLDVDGDCGGFNLQWAWSSGSVAGTSAALSLKEN